MAACNLTLYGFCFVCFSDAIVPLIVSMGVGKMAACLWVVVKGVGNWEPPLSRSVEAHHTTTTNKISIIISNTMEILILLSF